MTAPKDAATPSGHTPGPWVAVKARTLTHIRSVPADRLVTSVDRFRTGDAALIAAAPDLLAALKVYAEFDACANIDDPGEGLCTPEKPCVCCRARAAVAKAEGK